ncbi:MAG: cofactor-independent phosphoglycerate mutase [Oscillospiraceae bacterium]|nr:cofactor-independent phosphoglycerate mutase [Candidatus Equicaccousia limihippi]
MADYPCDALGGSTPMKRANKPNIDRLCKKAEIGLVKTVPDAFKPGSDVANLSAMGFNPENCYTGRSPLEAASIGIDLKDTDVTLRCNLVTLSDEQNYDHKTMVDYCAGDIDTPTAAKLIEFIQSKLGNDKYAFYAGVSYRHCLVVQNGTTDLGDMTPPHDISGKRVGEYLSKSENAKELIAMMKQSYDLLKDHPLNIERVKNGKRPANSVWFWGEGKKPAIPEFFGLHGKKGAVISAVDLLKGIGKCAKMDVPDVEGATGYIDSNFVAKEQTAEQLFENNDLVYIHMEAPDECGHRGEPENKVKSIEIIDQKVVGPIIEYLESKEDFRVLVMPDHPTPLVTRTHARDAVPYLIYDSRKPQNGADTFNEDTAKQSGIYIEKGYTVMARLLEEQ